MPGQQVLTEALAVRLQRFPACCHKGTAHGLHLRIYQKGRALHIFHLNLSEIDAGARLLPRCGQGSLHWAANIKPSTAQSRGRGDDGVSRSASRIPL